MRIVSLALIPALLLLAACGSEKKAPPAPAAGQPGAAAGMGTGVLPAGHPPMGAMTPTAATATTPEVVSGAAPEGSPIVWDVPKEWTAARPTNRMRVANFPLAEVDGKVVEVVVFSLGGSAEMNVQRWVAQLTYGEDDEPAQIRELEVNGLKVTRLDVTGNYGGGMGDVEGGHSGASNYRMLAVAVEGGGVPLQVKLVGPADIVAEHEKTFDAFVATIRPAE